MMVDCTNLVAEQICSVFGTTTEPFCQRCHLRCPRGSKQVAEHLPRANEPKANEPKKVAAGSPFVNQDGFLLDLTKWYAGQSLFLYLSGPSAAKVDHALLMKRGVMTMGVNNSSTVFRTQLWTSVDPPHKFHHGIWLDPAITKFCCNRWFLDRLRVKEDDGRFTYRDTQYKDCPGVIGYTRNASFNPETFLTENTVNFGNSSRWNEDKKRGNPRHALHPHAINVMFAALKIPYSLGFRKVFLLGADFSMPSSGPIYSFESEKDAEARRSNNMTYLRLNQMLGDLRPKFDDAGYEVYNCTEGSNLVAFPFKPLKEAINDATKFIPQAGQFDTSNWYAGAERKRG